MFLLHDAQFTGLLFWHAICARRAHVLAPLPSHHLPTSPRQLSDGSYLAVYLPSARQEMDLRLTSHLRTNPRVLKKL